MRPRPILAAAGCLAVVLVGCSDAESGPTTSVAAAATFATASSTTVAASIPSTTRAATTTTAPSTSPTTSTAATTTSTAATTTAPATTVAPSTSPAAATFTPVAAPAVPDVTHAIDAAWVDPATQSLLTVEDGSYWGTVVGQGIGDVGEQYLMFRLTQAFFGDACTAEFGDDSCDNDIGTLETPSGTMPLHVGAVRTTVSDPSTQQSYQVGSDVLFALVANPTAPPAGAPADYLYAPFAYLVQVSGGQIVSAEQVWTP